MAAMVQAVSAQGASQWAQVEFGHAELGHGARTKRAVLMAQAMLERPGGRVTEIFEVSAEREAAYRALESPSVDALALGEASTLAAVRRAAQHEAVYVPIDGTSLTLKSSPAKDLGDIGNHKSRSKGVHVQNAIIVAQDGEILGVAHQVYYRRRRRRKRLTLSQRRKLKLHQKETRHWLTCIEQTEAAFAKEQVDTERCYLLDRGGDFREMLEYSATAAHRVVIRSSWDRRLSSEDLDDEEKIYLRQALLEAPVFGHFTLNITAAKGRRARTATMQLRCEQYTFRLHNRWTHQVTLAPMSVVWAHEISEVPEGEKPLEWRLITNRCVSNFEEACEVVYAYTRRWRIEEMHRCWKTVCGVEKTRLRSLETIVKFATFMASVAARIEHLKTVSRTEPDAPASKLFSATELKAITTLRFDKGKEPAGEPTAEQAVCWLAQVGGYIGPRNGPPGAETIGRGLERVQVAVDVLVKIGWRHDPVWPLKESDQ
jgi:hypothetical protein